MTNPQQTTRRQFLRTSMLGGALSWSVPGFLSGTFDHLHAQTAASSVQPVTGKEGRILVVLQLAGGNDGLNTVVPFTDDHYHRARPKLRLDPGKILRLNDEVGLAPSLDSLKAIYDEGRATIVQGVGYPNPNRSHFRSTEIWHTATDADRTAREGWIGRYFDNACQGEDARVGIAISRQSPQAFANQGSKGISLQNPANLGADEADSEMMGAGDSVTDAPGMPAQASRSLDFLERVSLDARVSSDQIQQIMASARNQVSYPGNPLARDLSFIGRMIGGGMPTRIYYVSQGGFDTHRNQQGAHERLLGQFGTAIQAFLRDLEAQGNLDRVVVLTFSEFGRRVAENASGGTDHGAAAPLFLFGGGLQAGLTGQAPSLAPQDLAGGDLKHHLDFRSVYASLLDQWLEVAPAATNGILGRSFVRMPLIAG